MLGEGRQCRARLFSFQLIGAVVGQLSSPLDRVKTSGSLWVVAWPEDPAQAGDQRRVDAESGQFGGDPACKGTVLVGVLINAVMTAMARARAAKGLRVMVGPVARNPAEKDLGTDLCYQGEARR